MTWGSEDVRAASGFGSESERCVQLWLPLLLQDVFNITGMLQQLCISEENKMLSSLSSYQAARAQKENVFQIAIGSSDNTRLMESLIHYQIFATPERARPCSQVLARRASHEGHA